MADTVLSITQIENIFQALTASITSLDEDSGVRISWPVSGAPGWKITDDVSFIRVTPVGDPYTQQRETTYENEGQETSLSAKTIYTRVYQVQWIFYGPESVSNAQLIRDGLYKKENRELLKESNLYMILDVPQPQRIPELFNGQWWERADFSARFNEKVTLKSTVQTLESVNIIAVTDSGHQEVI